jgi:hypothetical protein
LQEKLQSEKPREAKKAEENKLFVKPVPAPGEYMATPKKEDQAVAAKLASEPVEGVGSGVFSEFLHEWAVNVSAVYQPTGEDTGCTPMFDVVYLNGHVNGIEPVAGCSSASERAFRTAINEAARPPMPTDFANHEIVIRFYDTGKR